MKSPKSGTRHPSGQPCAPRRMHIFPHFSEFLLIFHRRFEVDLKTLVCVREVFEQNPIWRRRVSGLVRRRPIRPVMDAIDSPARTEYDAHFFIFFVIFIHFCKIQRMPTHTVWSGCRVGRVFGCGKRKRHPKWKIDTTRANPVRRVECTFFHIFLNFC